MRPFAVICLALPAVAYPQLAYVVPPRPVQIVEAAALLDLQTKADAAWGKQNDWSVTIPLIENQWRVIDGLLARDQLRTGGDFYAASMLADDPMNSFERQRLRHELAIAALLLDEPNAPKLVAQTWDRLMMSLGRLGRFGTITRFDLEKGGPAPAELEPTSIPWIAEILKDPAGAKTRAAAAKDNLELVELRAADQKDREGDPMKPRTTEENLAWMRRDKARQKRVYEILKSGEALTPKNFEAAALVLQHSSEFAGYQLAHELCLASLTLEIGKPMKEKAAAWLVSRTYDRMLLSIGHRQRYGTNATMVGLSPVAPGINDRMRGLAGVKPLADQMKWGEDIRRRTLKGG